MSRNRSHFQRGSATFKCGVCGRLTRNPDHGGTELCVQCFDLCGLDNTVNDNRWELTPALIADRDYWFNEAVAKGGDGESIKRNNSFLWPKAKE